MFLRPGNRKFLLLEKPNTILKMGRSSRPIRTRGSNAEVHMENNHYGHEFCVQTFG